MPFDPNDFEDIPPSKPGQISQAERDAVMAKMAEQGQEAVPALAGSFMPEGTANPLKYLAEKSGLSGLLSKVPDTLMQSAVGMKKYIPGAGNNLVDQGVVGTRGMMQGQVAGKLAEQGAARDALLANLPGEVQSGPVANAVRQQQNRFTTPGGITPLEVAPEVNKITATANDIANRGNISPSEAGKLASIAGNLGYRGNEPVQKLAGSLGRVEHAGYRQQLGDLFSKANPGQPNQVEQTYGNLSSLEKAKAGLNVKEPTTLNSIANLKDLLSTAVGGALGGPVGSGVGYAASKAANTPLVKSVAAQGLQKGGQVAPQLMQRALGTEAALENQPQVLAPHQINPNDFEDIR